MMKIDSRSVQPKFGIIRLLNDLVFSLEGVDHYHWSENLLLDHLRVLGPVDEDDWLDQEWSIGAVACLHRCVWFAKLDISLDSLILRLVGLRSMVDISLRWIAERSTACQLAELFNERRLDAAMNIDAAIGHAAIKYQYSRGVITTASSILTKSARCSS
jgi:hypothetical protein